MINPKWIVTYGYVRQVQSYNVMTSTMSPADLADGWVEQLGWLDTWVDRRLHRRRLLWRNDKFDVIGWILLPHPMTRRELVAQFQMIQVMTESSVQMVSYKSEVRDLAGVQEFRNVYDAKRALKERKGKR